MGEGLADLVQVPWRPWLIASFLFHHLTMNILGLPDSDAPRYKSRGKEKDLAKVGIEDHRKRRAWDGCIRFEDVDDRRAWDERKCGWD